MKSLSDLWRCLADELARWCHTSATRDFNTVQRRVEHEGFSFFTITLPAFGKDFESCLDLGRIGLHDFDGFRRRGGLPVFMSGFLSHVFDADSGALLAHPSVDCIFAIRQLTCLYGKIELPCSNSRIARAMEGYVEIENELEKLDYAVRPGSLQAFERMSNFLFADVLSAVDAEIYYGDVEPRHGPGATANGLIGNEKFEQRTWTRRLEQIFPYGEYCIPNWRYYYLLDEVEFLEPEQEIPVRVIPVPKTLKGPRIIAMEPVWMQYMQQAIFRSLVRELEDPENLSSSYLGFTDQVPNRDLARLGSSTGELATLDLKEASDRVPHLLVKVMLKRYPHLLEAVEASRTTRAEIPILGLCLPNLRKFASMGSALCFPFEAMVFLTIVSLGILESRRENEWPQLPETGTSRVAPPSMSRFHELMGNARVYGDDIIVPTDCVDSVIWYLESYGFRINHQKSFWNGKFRESCGGDFYDGQDVTPVRLKHEFPTSLKDGSAVTSLVEFRNHLYEMGLWSTAKWLDEEHITKLLRGKYPIVLSTSPCLGRLSVLPWEAERVDERTQSPLVKGWVPRPRIPRNTVEEEWALVKCLSSRTMFEDVRHLDRSGRPSAVDIKLRWVTPF